MTKLAETVEAEGVPKFFSAERFDAALKASWEAEACADAALNMLCGPAADEDDFSQRAAMRALLFRLKTLSHVVMGALYDDGMKPESFRIMLNGSPDHG